MCHNNKIIRDAARFLFRFVLSALIVYVMTYSLLMYHGVRVYDADDWTLGSMDWYRFGPKGRVPGPFTIYTFTTCWANNVFWPMEWLRTTIWPPELDNDGLPRETQYSG